jgi:hypothetical protein
MYTEIEKNISLERNNNRMHNKRMEKGKDKENNKNKGGRKLKWRDNEEEGSELEERGQMGQKRGKENEEKKEEEGEGEEWNEMMEGTYDVGVGSVKRKVEDDLADIKKLNYEVWFFLFVSILIKT